MAKATSKKSSSTPPTTKKRKILSKDSLVAISSDISAQADVSITFTSGLGQATSSLFRNGVLINLQSISNSGNIHFSDVQSGDTISINGICSGGATIKINVPTNPATPQNFSAGNINTGYDIL